MGREGLKVGDRVRLKGYAADKEMELAVDVDGCIGVILYRTLKRDPQDRDTPWKVQLVKGGEVEVFAHGSQMVKLRKRERRRVYIERDKIPDRDCWRVHEGMCGETWLEEQKRRGADVSKWVEFTESPPRKAGAKERE